MFRNVFLFRKCTEPLTRSKFNDSLFLRLKFPLGLFATICKNKDTDPFLGWLQQYALLKTDPFLGYLQQYAISKLIPSWEAQQYAISLIFTLSRKTPNWWKLNVFGLKHLELILCTRLAGQIACFLRRFYMPFILLRRNWWHTNIWQKMEILREIYKEMSVAVRTAWWDDRARNGYYYIGTADIIIYARLLVRHARDMHLAFLAVFSGAISPCYFHSELFYWSKSSRTCSVNY